MRVPERPILAKADTGTKYAPGALYEYGALSGSCTAERCLRGLELGAGEMTQEKHFERLLKEFERVGVDPNTISAGLAVREEDVLRALHALPDDAGPSAFLTQLRLVMTQAAGHHD